MKLDATDLRYLTVEEFKVLRSVEIGSKNHEIVPTSLIAQLSHLAHSGINKLIAQLAKRNLIARVQNAKYDGYRLTYGGYDFLAVRKFREDQSVGKVGHRVGVGKESDIYLCSSPSDVQQILKIHRLGRISFRKIKEKRDYLGNRRSASWMYLSKLGAEKEFKFMQLLHQNSFPVPTPISHSRHSIVMSLIPAYPLRQIVSLPLDQIPKLYDALMKLIVKLARAGLIHGDFNEFNLLVKESFLEEEEDGEYGNGVAERDLEMESRSRKRDGNQILQLREMEKKGTGGSVDGGFDLRGQADDRRRGGFMEKEGEKVENGNGFQRIVKIETEKTQDEEEVEDEDEDEDSEESENEDEDEEDYEERREAKEKAKEEIHFQDGTTIKPILIDFPQMVSVQHENAEYFFDRDVECIQRFFRKRFRFHSKESPSFKEVMQVRDKVLKIRKEKKKALEKKERGGVDGLTDGVADLGKDGEEKVEGEKEEDVDDGSLGEILELDVEARASGWAGASKREKEEDRFLESVLSTNIKKPEGEGQPTETVEEEESEDSEEEEDSEDEDQDQEESEQVEGTAETLSISKKPKSKRSIKAKAKTSGIPSKGAAMKALADGDPRLVAQRVAAEKLRVEKKAAKHHGKKSNAAKGGRYHAGGKAKGDEVRNNMAF